MREILFKAKRKDWRDLPKEEWWVEGCILIDGITGQYFIHAIGNCLNESDKVGEEGYLMFFAYEVDPETVCQYTGLTDKNGKKIFEGDICKRTLLPQMITNVFRITYVSLQCCFSAIDLDGSNITFISDYINNHYEVEVIGNIFDNPELLNT